MRGPFYDLPAAIEPEFRAFIARLPDEWSADHPKDFEDRGRNGDPTLLQEILASEDYVFHAYFFEQEDDKPTVQITILVRTDCYREFETAWKVWLARNNVFTND